MDEFDFCRIADHLTLITAVALLCEIEPSRVHSQDQLGNEGYCVWYRDGNDPSVATDRDKSPGRFRTALDALVRAVQADTRRASVVYVGERRYVREPGGSTSGTRWLPVGPFDAGQTTVSVDELKAWLASRGVNSGFFFPSWDRPAGLHESRQSALRAEARRRSERMAGEP